MSRLSCTPHMELGMDHFMMQVSPEMVIATNITCFKQIVAIVAAQYRDCERNIARWAQRCDQLPDALQEHVREQIATAMQGLHATIDQALTDGVERMAQGYRDMSPVEQDVFWYTVHRYQTSLQDREGQVWWDEIVAR